MSGFGGKSFFPALQPIPASGQSQLSQDHVGVIAAGPKMEFMPQQKSTFQRLADLLRPLDTLPLLLLRQR